jgi:hypothetical protein
LAVPAVAVAASAEPDPIYAAIDVHRIAYAVWSKALKSQDAFDQEAPHGARIFLCDRPKVRMIIDGDPEQWGSCTVTHHPTGGTIPIYGTYPEDFKKYVPANLKGTARDEWITQKKQEWHVEQERLNEEFAQTPAGKLWLEANARSDEHSEAERRLFDTTATTIQGVLALLAYIRTDNYLRQSMNGWHLAALCDRSLCQIAGLPEPPSWFDDENDDQEA